MTDEEKNILDLISKAYSLFLRLPNPHPNDHREFCDHIHVLQRQVMARHTRRSFPELFPKRQ
jgi:hypothetical protein